MHIFGGQFPTAQLDTHHWSIPAFPSQAPIALHDPEGGTLVGGWLLGVGGAVPSVGTAVGLGPVPPPSACLTAFISGYLNQQWETIHFTCHIEMYCQVYLTLRRKTNGGCAFYHSTARGGLAVTALASIVSCQGSSPGRGHCVVFLGKTLYSHSASLHPDVWMCTGELNAGR